MRAITATTMLLAAPWLGGCTGWDTDGGASISCADSGETLGAVVTQVSIARQLEDGSMQGLNLDGEISAEGEEAGCYKQDFVSPDGREGIDNQLGTLLPVVEAVVGSENLDALLEGAIANGQLLIMIAVAGVDDPLNDDCVDLEIGAGLGTPFLDTEGEYVPYQTFGFDDRETPVSEIVKGRIEDGVLVAGPGRLRLPVKVLDADFELDLYYGHVRIDVQPDPLGGGARLSGVMGGGILADDVKGIVSGLTVGDDVVGAVVPIVAGLADLEPDEEGICRRVSAGLMFDTEPAFLYEGEPPADDPPTQPSE